jgi:hypothetical protein
MGVSGQRHAPTALCPGERTPGTHCTGDWVGPRAGLDTEVRGKILCLCQGSNPDHPVVQSVVRYYTDRATPAPEIYCTAILSTTNPTRTNTGSIPGLRGERPATNRLSYVTALLPLLLLLPFSKVKVKFWRSARMELFLL